MSRRQIRILVVHSKTFYFIDAGQQRGFSYDAGRAFEDEYDFDWLMLAAQGYQESRLDHGVKSRVGALGVMQAMPATGQELGVGDVREIEPNIHAGTKHLRAMMDRYFAGAEFDGLNRQLFAFASYNAGPAKIAKLRKEAAAQGLDPNVWFNNVEIVVSQRIGQALSASGRTLGRLERR